MDRVTDLATPSKRGLGQVIEWLVWSAIVGHAERITHVFLPLDDRGVDGIARRLDDDAMCAIQVKGRTYVHNGELNVVIRRPALDDDQLTVVVALLDPETLTLSPTVFAIDVPSILRLGMHSSNAGQPVVELSIPYPHNRGSRWDRFACELKELSDHLLPSLATAVVVYPNVPAPPTQDDFLGQLAELEVTRLLGEGPELNTFKSFPDIEIAEYLVRHRPTGNIRGVQVKCLVVKGANGYGMVHFHGKSFRASPVVDIVVLTYRSDLQSFDDHAWLIPAADMPTLRPVTRPANLVLLLHPAGGRRSKCDRYRFDRPDLAAQFTQRLERQ